MGRFVAPENNKLYILTYLHTYSHFHLNRVVNKNKNNNNIAEMAVFNVAGYLIEERRRWSVITASPRGQYYSK